MAKPLSRIAVVIGLGVILSLSLTTLASATVVAPLYPPGPPYARSGNGGQGPNMWSASGQGNPQFGRLGNIYWWQAPPFPTPPADHQ